MSLSALIIQFILVLLTASVYIRVAECKIGGLEFVGRGFDIMSGTMLPMDSTQILESYTKSNVYYVKNESEVKVKQVNDFKYDKISTTEVGHLGDYAKLSGQNISFSKKKTFGGNDGGGKGGGKGGMPKGMTVGVGGGGSFYSGTFKGFGFKNYISESSVVVNTIELVDPKESNYNPNFIKAVNSLPVTYDDSTKTDFSTFIRKFGTHYITKASLGGRMIFKTSLSRKQFSKMSSHSLSITATVTVNVAQIVSVSASVSHSQTYKQKVEKNEETYTIERFGYGGDPIHIQNKDSKKWAETVKDNVMPVKITLASFLPLVKDEARKKALRSALYEYLRGNLMADRSLQISEAPTKFLFNDRGSGAKMDLIITRPHKIPDGYRPLGDSWTEPKKKATVYRSVPVIKEVYPEGFKDFGDMIASPLIRAPVDLQPVWNDRGSGAKADFSFWKARCPEGYTAVGYVAALGKLGSFYQYPDVNLLTCVIARCVLPCGVGRTVWNTRGSNVKNQGVINTINSNQDTLCSGSFVVEKHSEKVKHDPNLANQYNCLARSCVKGASKFDNKNAAELYGIIDGNYEPPDKAPPAQPSNFKFAKCHGEPPQIIQKVLKAISAAKGKVEKGKGFFSKLAAKVKKKK